MVGEIAEMNRSLVLLASMVGVVAGGQLGLQAQPEPRATDVAGMAVSLTITTSSVAGAATANAVYVTLHGTHFDSPELTLSSTGFASGSTVSVPLSLPNHIGHLVSLRLRHGGVDAWKFTSLSAATEGRTAVFSRHNGWLVRTDTTADGTHQAPQTVASPDPNTTPGVETVVLYPVKKYGVAIDGVAGQAAL